MGLGKSFCSSALALAALGAALAGAQAQQPSAEEARLVREAQDRVPNTPGDGPYPAIIETDPGIPGHVVYRPADLAPFGGGKLPVLAWGNGGCATTAPRTDSTSPRSPPTAASWSQLATGGVGRARRTAPRRNVRRPAVGYLRLQRLPTM